MQKEGIIGEQTIDAFGEIYYLVNHGSLERSVNLVRNSCVIKVFGGVFMLSRCFLDCSVGVRVFVTGLSQISSFFS